MEDMSMAPVPTRPEQAAPWAPAAEPFQIPTPGFPLVPDAFGQIDSSVEGPGPEAPSRSFHLNPGSLPGQVPSPLQPEPLFPPPPGAPARPAPTAASPRAASPA